MKKGMAMLLSLILVMGFMGSVQVEAATKVTLKTYKNCTEINKVYPGGIARASTVKNKGEKINISLLLIKNCTI